MSSDNGLILHNVPAEQRVAEARARLMLARERTQATLVALRAEITEQTDWRSWVRARPGLFLAAAFLIGFTYARRR